MTTVKDIYDIIDSFAPFDTAEEWDNAGLLVGDGNAGVTKVLLSLDITNGVVEEAKECGAQLIISHHPIIFGSGLKRLAASSPVYRAAAYGVACICAHTNLDKSPVFGVNTVLAEAAGLQNCRVSEKNEILFLADTPEKCSPEELAAQIKQRMGLCGVAFTRSGGDVGKVGICSGGGGSEIYSAAAEGCSAFITGEIKHHELVFANENGVSTFILGHYASEDVVLEPLGQRLHSAFPEVSFIKSSVFTDGMGVI